ncbi:hypothetical protein [Halosegnis sp.]|uniref:hypothetical protein n=1 Tax=Halosegnis sp. TaxID=2864959 RepID=UPI0035D4678C
MATDASGYGTRSIPDAARLVKQTEPWLLLVGYVFTGALASLATMTIVLTIAARLPGVAGFIAFMPFGVTAVMGTLSATRRCFANLADRTGVRTLPPLERPE